MKFFRMENRERGCGSYLSVNFGVKIAKNETSLLFDS